MEIKKNKTISMCVQFRSSKTIFPGKIILIHLSKEIIKRSRASVEREDILIFFANINEVDAQDFNIYNYDETNVTDDPGAKKMIVPRNTKISIMVCGNATGDLLPPMVVYTSGNLYEYWTEGGPSGTKYASSPSGWFDMNLF
ncbi:hypothetical protein NQ315_002432 [Exocentrus adspersus]|uniref:DDE-1 domain-containing protein n=1 Tax=Exocentrus adspersus TaxID=1586481 RepID=A0AAV8VI41_9CUCU|nr:hypothetical protein NQ315_002432 [Exocentrus adspersus]